jgi:hypothetical protein
VNADYINWHHFREKKFFDGIISTNALFIRFNGFFARCTPLTTMYRVASIKWSFSFTTRPLSSEQAIELCVYLIQWD